MIKGCTVEAWYLAQSAVDLLAVSGHQSPHLNCAVPAAEAAHAGRDLLADPAVTALPLLLVQHAGHAVSAGPAETALPAGYAVQPAPAVPADSDQQS